MTNEPREEEEDEEEEGEGKSATLPCQSSKAYTKGNLATIRGPPWGVSVARYKIIYVVTTHSSSLLLAILTNILSLKYT